MMTAFSLPPGAKTGGCPCPAERANTPKTGISVLNNYAQEGQNKFKETIKISFPKPNRTSHHERNHATSESGGGKITEDQEDLNIRFTHIGCQRVTIKTKGRKVLVILDPPGALFPGFGHPGRSVLSVPVPQGTGGTPQIPTDTGDFRNRKQHVGKSSLSPVKK